MSPISNWKLVFICNWYLLVFIEICLKRNPQLNSLNLSDNSIGNKGAIALANVYWADAGVHRHGGLTPLEGLRRGQNACRAGVRQICLTCEDRIRISRGRRSASRAAKESARAPHAPRARPRSTCSVTCSGESRWSMACLRP